MTPVDQEPRWFVPPLGWPPKPRIVTVNPADRPRRLITLNRYPRQVIGFAIRLPDLELIGRRRHVALSVLWCQPARWWAKRSHEVRSRVIRHESGAVRFKLPDVEAEGVARLGCWVTRSPFPGTRRWEWVVTNMPVTAVPGMSSGFCLTRWGAKRAVRRALRFWESYGYPIDWAGAR